MNVATKHIPTHSMSWHAESAGQQQTQKPYEKMLRIQKECYQSYNFGTATDTSARDIVFALFIFKLWYFAFRIK